MDSLIATGGRATNHDVQQAFDGHAADWVQYTQSAGGKLRHATVLLHLRQRFAAAGERSLRILDAGGGAGEMAADLAALGHHVTLLDFSAPMLALARSRCEERGALVEFICADAWHVQSLWQPGSFDVVLCHSLLEFADDPAPLLAQLVALLRPDGTLSVVIGNRHALVLRAALVQGDLHAARLGLDSEIAAHDLFGLPRRTFFPAEARALVRDAGMTIVREYGVRIFCDLLTTVSDWQALHALEIAASSRLPYRRLGRFIHILAAKKTAGEPQATPRGDS